MSLPLYIVTGTSRGLGFEIARQLLQQPCRMLTMARRAHPELAQAASEHHSKFLHWSVDLQYPSTCAARLEAWLKELEPQEIQSATLINNAGVIGGVGPIQDLPVEHLSAALRINLESPMALTAAFLRVSAGWSGERKVLNISSGAGRHAIAGWSVYCASKAGLDHFSRVTAMDEALQPQGAKIVSLAPGVIDTDMQTELRAAASAGFPDKPRFVELHASGQLSSAQHAAAQVLAFLSRPDFGTEPVADVRHT